MSSEKLTCSKCFKNIQKNCSIICEVCRCKFHKLCAKIEDDGAFNALNNFENIVFNCDNCLQTSRDLIQKISILSCEIEQIKMLFSQFLENNVKNNNKQSASHCSLPTKNTGLFPKLSMPSLAQSKQTIGAQFSDSNAKQLAANNSVAAIAVNDAAAVCVGDNNTGLFPKLPIPSLLLSKQTTTSIGTQSIANCDAPAAFAVDNISHLEAVNVTEYNVNSDEYAVDETNAVGGVVIDNQSISNATFGANNFVNVNSEWNNVTRRKKSARTRRVVFGQNNNSELEVALKYKWVHLSSFKTSVTEENIILYLMKHLKIDREQIVCYKLVKKGSSMDHLKFVNFKLGIISSHYEGLFNPQLWSSAIKIRPFTFFPKIVNPLQQL